MAKSFFAVRKRLLRRFNFKRYAKSDPDLRAGAEVSRGTVQTLEPRQMLSVSMSSDGWTTVTPAADTRIVYVSSSTGNDSNSGLSASSPVKTIDRGKSLLRNNSADWLLLKAGDTWNSGLGSWRISGRSDQEPLLIGSYGTGARPLLQTGTSSGFWAAAVSAQEVDHIDIIGLHFYANGRDPNSPSYVGPTNTTGIQFLARSEGLTIEDCQIEDYAVNVNIQNFYGPITNVTFRRNIVDDAYATTSHSQGLYAYGVTNLLIEGNTFDHNGYNDQVPGAGATYFNHDAYISSNNTGVVVRDNIFARAAGYGLQDRPGGIVENNLFINDPIGMSFGLVNGSHTTAGGVTGIVNGNVFVGGGNLNGYPYGQGIVLGNTMPGSPTVVSNNIFADGLAHAPAAITLTYGIGQIDPQNSVGLNNLTIEDNIVYNWYRGLYVDGGFEPGGTGLKALNDVTISGNEFQNVAGAVVQMQDADDSSQLHFAGNTYSADPSMLVAAKKRTIGQWTTENSTGDSVGAVAYADPTRTLESYDALVGGLGTDANFLVGARGQSQQTWYDAYTAQSMIDYMRNGFTSPTMVHSWAPPTPPTVVASSFPATAMARDTSLTFTVTYQDDQAIDAASLSSDNLTVTARNYTHTATLVSAQTNGNQVTATYSVPAPNGVFRQGQNIAMAVTLNAGQVRDNQGFAAAAAPIGTIKLHVLARPKAPTAQQVRLVHHGQALAIRFSSDVSASLQTSDLVLESLDGQTVDPSQTTLAWDGVHKTAYWSFTGEPNGELPAGKWIVRVSAATLVDATGQQLDGNRDGMGGDDYVMRRPVTVK